MSMKSNIHRINSIAALALIAASATAQEKVSMAIEEVVVTSEHREASLQDTQISISAFNSDSLQEMGISNAGDLGQFTPNVTITPYIGGRTGIGVNMRGMGQNETLIAYDPAVGMYIDNVLVSKNVGALLDVLEMERIEVLRGPQGTLYGRNTMGGTVNIITKKPAPEIEAKLQTTLGNYGQKNLRGMINTPLTRADSNIGELNLRISGATLNRDGIQDNVLGGAPNDELGTVDREVVLAQLLWQPTDSLEVLYSIDRTRIDEIPLTPYATTYNPQGLMARLGYDLTPFIPQQSDRPDSIMVNGEHVSKTESDGQSLNITVDFSDDMTFHAITGYREMENVGEADSDGTPFTLVSTDDQQAYESLTQEFRLVGTTFDTRLDYTVGAFYINEEGELSSATAVLGSSGSRLIEAQFENSSWAAYGQATYNMTDKWTLTGGLRYTEESREMSKTQGGVPYPEASADFDNISPMVAVGFDWSENVNTYVKISSGFQSGGFNVREVNESLFTDGFKEENILAYELGIKATTPDQRFRINSAFWFSDYDDKRVNILNPDTLSNVVRNAGVVEIAGLELEVLANLTSNIQAGLDWGSTFPKFVEFNSFDTNGNPVDLSDQANFPYTPKHKVHGHVTYEFPHLDFGSLRARVDWTYQDSITFLLPKPERNSATSFNLWNARLTLDELQGPGDTTLRIALWGKNLTDESYWNNGVNIYNGLGFDINTYGDPRTWGVDFEIQL